MRFSNQPKAEPKIVRCIETFLKQTVKFDRSLGVGQGWNVCRDVTMKVRWQMSKKEEVARFRAELAQHVSSLHMLLRIANMSVFTALLNDAC